MTLKIRKSPLYAGEKVSILDKGLGGEIKCIYAAPVVSGLNPYCPSDTNPATGIDVSTLAMYDPPVTARGEWSLTSPVAVHRPESYAGYFVAVGMQSGIMYQINLTSDVDAVDPPTGNPVDTYMYLLDGPCSNAAEITHDDDSGGYGQSMILFTPMVTGDYCIEATTYGPSTTGYYQVSVVIPAT